MRVDATAGTGATAIKASFGTAKNSRSELGKARENRDTILGVQFGVEFDGLMVAGFKECSAPTMETEIYEYNEGGENGYTHKLPVRHKFGNITLKRGMDEGRDLWIWYSETIEGKGKRKNITIHVYGPVPERPAVRTYILHRAFPVKWTGPDMKSDAGAVAVETLELAHEGLEVKLAGQ